MNPLTFWLKKSLSLEVYTGHVMNQFQLISVEPLTASSVLLTMQAKRPKDALRFYPGQYAAIGFKKAGRPSPVRCFSVITVPERPDVLQFGMRIEGNFTQTAARLTPGTKVFIRGPFGNFVVDEQQDRNLVMLAGGIGITPFVSMIRAATHYRSPKPMVLLYSCRSQNDIPFYDEILELEQRNPRFKAVFFITGGDVDKGRPGHFISGRITGRRLEELSHGRPNFFTYFLCGPKSFMRSMETELISNNTDPAQIVTEDFTASSPATAASAPTFSIPRWTYGLTAASLLAGVAFIGGLDLVRAVPRLARASITRPVTGNTASSSTLQATSSDTTPPTATTAPDNSVAPAPSNPPSTQAPAPQPQQAPSYYQPPMTSVS